MKSRILCFTITGVNPHREPLCVKLNEPGTEPQPLRSSLLEEPMEELGTEWL